MFINHLKIAIRGYFRNSTFTILNLISLVIGLFVLYIAIGYIRYEYSYDAFHKNANEIYRLAKTYRTQDYSVIDFERDATGADLQVSQVDKIKTITGIKDATQFIISESVEYVEADNKRIQEKNILFTNTAASFTSVFSWQLTKGSFTNFTAGYNKVMLTESTAKKLFGNNFSHDAPIHSIIKIAGEQYELAAIIKDVPANSHFDFNMVLNTKKINYWGSRIYLQLEKNTAHKDVEVKINQSIAFINNRTSKDPLYKKHFLQPLTAIHLKSNILYETKPPGNYKYIILIALFGLVVITITLFNFTNLSLALHSKKSKTTGIRKVIGANNFAIVFQLLTESMLLSLLALPVVWLLIYSIVPYFNKLMAVSLQNNFFNDLSAFLILMLVTVTIGLVAVVAPYFYISSKNILVLFKQNITGNVFQQFPLRKYLIVSQFIILICITSVCYIITAQIKFIKNKNIGFAKEGIIYAYTSEQNQNVFQQKLKQIPQIKLVGNGSTFGINTFNKLTYRLQNETVVFDDAHQLYLDSNAIKAYQLQLSSKWKSNVNNGGPAKILINRTAAETFAKVKKIELDDLIGTSIITEPEYVNEKGEAGIPYTIAGIFEDINLFSLHEKIEPYFITVSEKVRMDGRTIIAYDTKATKNVLDAINKVHKELNEPYPLELQFLNENLENLHHQDIQTADLLFYFNLIAVLLSALGIIGMTIFLVTARTKETGIRKILGASVFSIIRSSIKEYVVFILTALLIAWPIAYYTANEWLSEFAYHIPVKQPVFLLVGFFTFFLTAVIVSVIIYKSSIANPVKSLRTE